MSMLKGSNSRRAGYSTLSALVGLWLLLSPFVLRLAPPSLASALGVGSLSMAVFGLVVISLGTAAIISENSSMVWAEFAIGSFMLVLPWIVEFEGDPTATLNCLLSGVAVLFCAITVLYRDAAAIK
jgi:peptidoglycan/LPS O-acetylase OafA/YrhL